MHTANQWFFKTPERALNQAYNAASTIKSIEDEHSNDNKLSTDITNRSNSATSYLQIVHGLSDSAKAFIIILFTDAFVDFHSPHGWEDIFEGVATHLGLPANRNLISLFIATFPVILDIIFKFWIFRYMSMLSPAAVATYRNMNE